MLKNIFSVLFILTIFLSIYFLTQVIFLLAMAYIIAYILAPIITKLSSKLKNQTLALGATFVTFWTLIIMIFAAILPQVYDQASLFIAKIPKYEMYVKSILMPYAAKKIQMIHPLALSKFSGMFDDLTSHVFNIIFAMLSNVWSYAKITIDILLFCVLLPIVSFYFIKDSNLMPKCLETTRPFLNDKAASFLLDCASLITEFIRGQLNVCLVMILYYAFFLSVLQIDFALLLGLISGISVAIPFAGILCSILLCSIITIVNFGIDYHLVYVLVLYFVGQLLEGYFVTPRIIGDKIGLHPLLMILALIAFGKIFGILGLFVAIPATCIIKTLLKHLKPYL